MTTRIVLELPYPLSSNRYWRSFPHPHTKRVVTTLSAEAKAYKRRVREIAALAGIRKPIAGRVQIDIQVYPERPQDWAKRAERDPVYWDDTVRCIDLDNARKVLYDALKGVVIEDDSRKHIRKDSGEIMEPDGPGRVVVTVTPYEKPAQQGALFALEA